MSKGIFVIKLFLNQRTPIAGRVSARFEGNIMLCNFYSKVLFGKPSNFSVVS